MDAPSHLVMLVCLWCWSLDSMLDDTGRIASYSYRSDEFLIISVHFGSEWCVCNTSFTPTVIRCTLKGAFALKNLAFGIDSALFYSLHTLAPLRKAFHHKNCDINFTRRVLLS